MTIKDLRKQASLTQQQLADAVGINITQIQRLENGTAKTENITLKNALALAKELGVEPKDLL